MKSKRICISFILSSLILNIFVYAVFSADTNIINTVDNKVTVVSMSSDETYKIESSLINIKSQDNDSGMLEFTADLLSSTEDVDQIVIKVNRSDSAKSDFKFSSSSKAQGLLASTGQFTEDEKSSIVSPGLAQLTNSYFDIYCQAGMIGINSGVFNSGENGKIISCRFLYNENYDSNYKDWRNGFSDALYIEYSIFANNELKAQITSDTFSLPEAKSITNDSNELQTYKAYLQNPSPTEIAAGGTFTADVYMTASDGKLAGGQLELNCEGGTITNIALADGLTNGEQSDLSKISFYGNTGDATNGIKVATVTVSTAETVLEPVVLSIKDGGKAAVSGSYNDKDVTLEDATKSVTVNIQKKDQFSCSAYADASGKYLVQYTGTVGDGNVVKYTSESTETNLYYSEKYGTWVFLADSDLSSTLTNANFSVVSGDKTSATIKYDGDVNKNGTTNIVDAQIAYDISNNVYPTFEALPMEMWLSADVNKVIGVAAGDARAIQCIIHGITE